MFLSFLKVTTRDLVNHMAKIPTQNFPDQTLDTEFNVPLLP